MKIATATTYWVRIYISGPIAEVERVCRAECLRDGLCVTVEPTRFIYTGGEETGAVVGLINYPRFPADPLQIRNRARILAAELLAKTHQHSVLIMTPDAGTEWITIRETAAS